MASHERKKRDPAIVSRTMSAIHGKDTRVEKIFRGALFAKGVRYRKHYKRLKGTPDLVIVWARIAVFIDGDFWHGNGWRLRGLPNLASQFPTNTEFWVAKITRNIERDGQTNHYLEDLGWTVLRFWESEIKSDLDGCVERVAQEVGKKKSESKSN